MSESSTRRGGAGRQEVDAVLAAALERPPAERMAFVRAACRDDPRLVERVATLLDAESSAPPAAGAAALAVPAPGDRLGAYRLEREIGRGGMSVVYLAERDDRSFRKRAAVKFVQPLLADPHFLRRFQDEREILARLEHPAIARILDGGQTAQGIPYFVMEYVEGRPLDAYCEGRGLRVEERLALFLKIGAAVAYAHQNLVVHRDLKPGNVLVTEAGEVKLLDFGISRALSGPTDAARATLTGERLMTPAYASPEQVRGEPARTASDVYSLGVLLYELLARRSPHATAALPHEIARAVLEQEPLRPSAAAAEPALARRLRGDLDVIAMKALRKEPERRYASVDALMQDVRRHLAGEAVAARGDAWSYRLGRLARRRWAALAAAGAILAAAASLSIFYTRRIEDERDLARRERDKADAEARKAQAVTDYLVSLFEASKQSVAPERRADALTARALLDEGAARIERELTGQPEVRARLLYVLARIHQRLGLLDHAEALYGEALATRRRLLGEAHADVSDSMAGLGRLLLDRGQYAKAEPLLRRSHALSVAIHGAESAQAAAALSHLGRLLSATNRLAEAERCHREALRIRRSVMGGERVETLESVTNLAVVRQRQGHLEEAEALYRQALEAWSRLRGRQHPHTVQTMSNLAVLLHRTGDFAAAEPLYREVLDTQRKLFGPRHPNVTVALANLALLLSDRGEAAAAEPMAREVLELRRALLGPEHPLVAQVLSVLGSVLLQKGDLAGAEARYTEALALNRKVFGKVHPMVANGLVGLGNVARARGALARAESVYREALAMRRATLAADHPDLADIGASLGRTLVELGRPDEAYPLLREALRIAEKGLPPKHAVVGLSRAGLGACLRAQRRYAEAEPLLVSAEQTLRSAPQKPARTMEWVLRELAALFEATGRPEQARVYRQRLPERTAAAGR